MSVPVPPWRQRASRSRAAKRPLSVESVVAAAVELLDAEGLDAVSMRRVAQRLDTGAASLYAYVRNKDELQELMLDEIIGEIPLPEPDPARWQEQVKDLIREQLRVYQAHPGIAQVVMRTPAPTGPNALAASEAFLSLLRAAGFSDRITAFAVDLLVLYPTAVAMERTASFGLGEAELAERMEQVRRYFSELPADRFPTMTALIPVLFEGSGDERFEFGLDILVQGLAAHLS